MHSNTTLGIYRDLVRMQWLLRQIQCRIRSNTPHTTHRGTIRCDNIHVWNRPHEMILARNARRRAQRFLRAFGLSVLGGFR